MARGRKATRKQRLTSLTVRTARAEKAAYQIWDSMQRGLALRVQLTGAKSWIVVYSHQGRSRWLTLGSADVIGLADARAAAKKILTRVALGEDVADRIGSHERIPRKALSFIEQNIEPKGYLYRHFGPDGDLLYVGQSLAPLARNGAHLKTANWKTQISIIAIEPFATREEALAAEELAIRTEYPKHNEAHNKPRHPLHELRRLDRSHRGERAAGIE